MSPAGHNPPERSGVAEEIGKGVNDPVERCNPVAMELSFANTAVLQS